jgi:hypothetical protein
MNNLLDNNEVVTLTKLREMNPRLRRAVNQPRVIVPTFEYEAGPRLSPLVVLFAVVFVVVTIACATGYAFRGGNEWVGSVVRALGLAK